MDWLTNPEIWAALVTLTALEIVLGIDNIVFISVLTSRLPRADRGRARSLGLGAALVTRVLLLLTLSWVVSLTQPFVTLLGIEISGRDLILLGGGLFLIAKATTEIHGALEGQVEPEDEAADDGSAIQAAANPAVIPAGPRFSAVIVQIGLLDVVFSLDSVITAVGMANQIPVMVAAIAIAIGVMLFASGPLSDFIEGHPTVKILALAFLVLIGTSLVAEGFEFHIPKEYLYFAMAFSVGVELLNLRVRPRAEPVHLRPDADEDDPAT